MDIAFTMTCLSGRVEVKITMSHTLNAFRNVQCMIV